MRTIDQVSKERGHTSGFDYLRLTLSTSVIAWHAVLVCYGSDVDTALWASHFRPLVLFILPSFFALSGFLVAGSLERNSLSAFLMLRVLRIVPALAFEILLSSLLIGPLVTSLDLKAYFSSVVFRSYFLNIVGYIHYQLPGVFTNLPIDQVNRQLWTIPYELECYIAIAVLAVIGLVSRPRLLLAALLFGITYNLSRHFMAGSWLEPSGRILVVSFLFGAGLFFLRTVIPYNKWMFVISLGMTWVLLTSNSTMYFATPPVAYATVYVGLLNPRRIFLVRGADYSYGLYLFGFPTQQLVALALPSLRFPLVNFLLSWPLAWVFAWISWYFVESKVLGRKKWFVSTVDGAASEINRWLHLAFLRGLDRVKPFRE